jgi:Tfp pilus assembly protein PilX
MKIAKPMLLVTTPIGVVLGIYEGFRLAGGLVFLMIALLSLIGVAFGTLVATVRRENREELARSAAARAAHATLPEKAGTP